MGATAKDGSSTHRSTLFSTRWLLWQYDELMRSPLEGVNAAPLESDIYEWHGNFYFPEDHEFYPSLVLHFALHLPRDFPNSTPDVRLLTTIPHSHVFGDSICFSLLSSFEGHFQGMPETSFWNPSRSIRSLLESVYVFLKVDEDRHSHRYSKASTEAALHKAQKCRCTGCGHQPSRGKTWPPEEYWLAAKSSNAPLSSPAGNGANDDEERACALAMHEDITATADIKPPAASKPPPPKVSAAQRLAGIRPVVADINQSTTVVRKVSKKVDKPPKSFEERSALLKAQADEMVAMASNEAPAGLRQEALQDFRCSMTGISFSHTATVVLGFGVHVQYRPRDGSIESITTDLSPISMEVFYKGRIRKSALGAPITHFFPFAINEQHWERANRVLPGCVNAILGNSPEAESLRAHEDKLLVVVGELWKSMAVLMMKGETHTSEKVLKGFCSFHHLLLLATGEPDPVLSHSPVLKSFLSSSAGETNEPGWTTVINSKQHGAKKADDASSPLLQLANDKVRKFARNPWMRHKARCPDFGRFLPTILLSNVTWDEVKRPFLGELLARNARWICQENRQLQVVRPDERIRLSGRVEQSWDANNTGLRLTAFQIRFFNSVVGWARSAFPADIVKAYERHPNSKQFLVRAMYNTLGGRPTPEMLSQFQEEAKRIEAMGSFREFFQSVAMPLTEMDVQIMLCEAMQDSERYGYHRTC